MTRQEFIAKTARKLFFKIAKKRVASVYGYECLDPSSEDVRRAVVLAKTMADELEYNKEAPWRKEGSKD